MSAAAPIIKTFDLSMIPETKATAMRDYQVEMGERIRKLREHIGMVQSDIAADFGISTSAVSMWEKGKADPGVNKIAKLAKLLKTTPEYIAFGVEYSDPIRSRTSRRQ